MKLKILSFGGESFSSDKVESITLMTGTGEITILPNHAPLLTSIKPSTLFVKYEDMN
jgi:F0F1-type ATP synthase epsilon subunit